MTKHIVFAAATVTLCLMLAFTVACMKIPTTVTPPSSTETRVVDGLEALQVSCEAGAPFAGAAGIIIAQVCPPFVTGAINIIESGGTVATLNALFATLRSELAAVPGGASNVLATSILNGAQAIINIFVGQTTPAVSASASARVAPMVSVPLTAAGKARLESIRKRALKIKPGSASVRRSVGDVLGEALFGGGR